jgi:hypothetical protein
MGPAPADINMDHAPLTQAGLDQWARSIGPALVDRGTLFGSDGCGVTDRGVVHTGPLPIHGYSIVDAANLAGAVALTQGHPFLANGQDANFEIQILDFIAGERPFNIAEIPMSYIPGSPVESQMPLIPPITQNPAFSSQVPQPQVPSPQAPLSPPGQTQPDVIVPSTNVAPPQTPGELSIPHDEPENRPPGAGPGILPPPTQ